MTTDDSIYMSVLDRNFHNGDGTIKLDYRKYLKEKGITDAEIARRERYMKEEIEDNKLFDYRPGARRTKDRVIASSGLDVEELLSQGYLNVDELDEIEDLDSFDIDDLL